MALILPPHLQNKMRPLVNIATEDLLKELHARGFIHELSGTIAVPITARGDIVKLQTEELYRQMGVVIGQSGLSFTSLNKTAIQEEIVAKVLICRHPQTIQQAPGEQLPQQALPLSGTSLPFEGS